MSLRFLLTVCAVAALGSLAFLGCSHSTFDTCLRSAATARVEARVAYALACKGDKRCLETEGVYDAAGFALDALQCQAAPVDAGGQ